MTVIETTVLSYSEISDAPTAPLPASTPERKDSGAHLSGGGRLFWQMPRFAVVGMLNATLDLLVLNGLLWLFPTTVTWRILFYTIVAYGVGAINSFLLNKYWTFGHTQRPTWREIVRFVATNAFGLTWNLALLWLASLVPHPFVPNAVLWTNASKMVAISSAACVSFVGMRLWVFVKPTRTPITQKQPAPDVQYADEQGEVLESSHLFPIENQHR